MGIDNAVIGEAIVPEPLTFVLLSAGIHALAGVRGALTEAVQTLQQRQTVILDLFASQGGSFSISDRRVTLFRPGYLK